MRGWLIAVSVYMLCAVACSQTSNSGDLPKPNLAPTPGTWKYQEKVARPQRGLAAMVGPQGTHVPTYSLTIKDGGTVWTVTTHWDFAEGPVNDVVTLDKSTLILRNEVFTHFLHPDQTWKPVRIELDFAGNKVTGTMKFAGHPDKPVASNLSAPVFALGATDITVGCLPLAVGYATTIRIFDIEKQALDRPDKERLVQVNVVGSERVSVPAGAFDTYKVELISDHGTDKETLWIAKDTRILIKTYEVQVYGNGLKQNTVTSTMELVP
jgi:hypothetical protein